MSIALIGTADRRAECLQRLPELHPSWNGEAVPDNLPAFSVVLDVNLDEAPHRLEQYASLTDTLVLGCAVKQTLAEMMLSIKSPLTCTLIGWNALPTFLNRPIWEISLFQETDQAALQAFLEKWEVEFQLVEDQIGMVTPRILFMIMNEAYVVMQEGTADAAGIDLAMRFGTNYPQGPVAWSQEIGLQNLVEVLDKLRTETGEGRYRVAPLLRRKMRQQKLAQS